MTHTCLAAALGRTRPTRSGPEACPHAASPSERSRAPCPAGGAIWLFLETFALTGRLGAYAVAALVAFVLAVGLGLVQRGIERHRAELVSHRPVEDDSEHPRYLLDAMMSAPWQVCPRANLPATDGHVGSPPRDGVPLGAG